MTEGRLKVMLGFYLMIAQCVLVATPIYFAASGGLLFGELTLILGFVVPLFSGYLTLVVKYFIDNRYIETVGANMEVVRAPYVVMALFFPTAFTVFLLVCILMKVYNTGFRDIEDFKVLVGIGETAFGVYIAQFVYSMFESSEKKRNDKDET